MEKTGVDKSGMGILPCKLRKNTKSSDTSFNRKINEKVTVDAKCYLKQQGTCNISMFMYLMTSKIVSWIVKK